MENLDVKYFRFMEDILIFAPTRWKLKKAIRVLNETFNELLLEKYFKVIAEYSCFLSSCYGVPRRR
jgi:hypothetical protein